MQPKPKQRAPSKSPPRSRRRPYPAQGMSAEVSAMKRVAPHSLPNNIFLRDNPAAWIGARVDSSPEHPQNDLGFSPWSLFCFEGPDSAPCGKSVFARAPPLPPKMGPRQVHPTARSRCSWPPVVNELEPLCSDSEVDPFGKEQPSSGPGCEAQTSSETRIQKAASPLCSPSSLGRNPPPRPEPQFPVPLRLFSIRS